MSKAKIFYHDIGDYLDQKEKLQIIKKAKSFANLPMQLIEPNEHGDWVIERNANFETLIPIGNKSDKESNTFFTSVYSRGLGTSRDAWVYNYSKNKLMEQMKLLIDNYNLQVDNFSKEKYSNPKTNIEDIIETDAKKIAWTSDLKADLIKGLKHNFTKKYVIASYRPYCKQFIYLDRNFIYEYSFVASKMFPSNDLPNKVICVSGVGVTKDFSTIITDTLPDLELIGKSQCFPLYYYEENNATQKGLFDEDSKKDYIRRDAVSDFILDRAKKQYGLTTTAPRKEGNISKEDIFYYVYGFLHCPTYRETFANDLKKMLPRLPLVEEVRDFWAFSKAGRKLADLHLNYETVAPAKGVVVLYNPLSIKDTMSQIQKDELEYLNYRVTKMRFPKKDQKDIIIYNSQITIENIPAQAYEYVVNGKSAIEWIMERYQITTHKESGITNNPNDWATEVGNPRYILDLLLSIINVSVQTVAIVNALPKVDFGTEPLDSKVVKMYPTQEESTEVNIAAEPDANE